MAEQVAKKKKFRLFDAILSVICVVFVAEAAAPAAAIGNTQYFWWIFLIITFLLPYGLIVSELGTTYNDEGGLYDWVKRAFGDKWGARVSFYYWINFPLWMAALAVLVPTVLGGIIAPVEGLDYLPSVALSLAFIWIGTFITFSKVSDATWILNTAAVLKVLVAITLFGLGVWYVSQNGFANEAAGVGDFFPNITDPQSLTYLSIILFNFMGFEVITTYAGDMDNPKKEIPKAIIAGGLAIAVIYLISSFGIGAAIPTAELSLDSGIMDAVAIMTGEGSIILVLISIVFLLTLFGNIVSWSFGVNYVADYAAKDSNMPKPFAIESKKNEMPIGASLINAVIASVLVIIIPLLEQAGDGGFFWIFFAMNVVFLLMAYIPMFPAFLKLRKIDPSANRPFSVPGNKVVTTIMAIVPAVLLVLAIVATIVPLDGSEAEMEKLPMLAGVLIFIVIGEIVRIFSQRGKKNTSAPIGATDEAPAIEDAQ